MKINVILRALLPIALFACTNSLSVLVKFNGATVYKPTAHRLSFFKSHVKKDNIDYAAINQCRIMHNMTEDPSTQRISLQNTASAAKLRKHKLYIIPHRRPSKGKELCQADQYSKNKIDRSVENSSFEPKATNKCKMKKCPNINNWFNHRMTTDTKKRRNFLLSHALHNTTQKQYRKS
jgi:hypothetical protein